MERAVLPILLIGVLSLSGCAAMSQKRPTQIVNLNMPANPLPASTSMPKAVPASEADVAALKRDGWARIGDIEVIFRLDERVGREGKTRTFDKNKDADATATLLATAAEKGGQLVVLEEDNVVGPDYGATRGKCTYKELTAVNVYNSSGMKVGTEGGRDVCTEWETIEIKFTNRSSKGSVWRRDKELADAIARAEQHGWERAVHHPPEDPYHATYDTCGYKNPLGVWVIPDRYSYCSKSWTRQEDGSLNALVYRLGWDSDLHESVYERIWIDMKGNEVGTLPPVGVGAIPFDLQP